MVRIFFCLILFTSCASFVDRPKARSFYPYIQGPIPDNVAIRTVKDDLTRTKFVSKVGHIRLMLLSPAYIYMNAHSEEHFKGLTPREAKRKIQNELEFLSNRETCLSLNVETHNPIVLDFKLWSGILIDHTGRSLGLSFKDMTDEIYGGPWKQSEKIGAYQGYVTLCTNRPINPAQEFTVLLKPNYRPGLRSSLILAINFLLVGEVMEEYLSTNWPSLFRRNFSKFQDISPSSFVSN
jgi:hypothetical protein